MFIVQSMKVVTRAGSDATFLCDDRHDVYPLTYMVEGRVRSYTREGRWGAEGPTPLDLIPIEEFTAVNFQLELF